MFEIIPTTQQDAYIIRYWVIKYYTAVSIWVLICQYQIAKLVLFFGKNSKAIGRPPCCNETRTIPQSLVRSRRSGPNTSFPVLWANCNAYELSDDNRRVSRTESIYTSPLTRINRAAKDRPVFFLLLFTTQFLEWFKRGTTRIDQVYTLQPQFW